MTDDGKFQKLAHAEPSWHRSADAELVHHTAAAADAASLTRGYLSFLRKIAGWRLPAENRCLDLGAGAGHITRAFNSAGARMAACEHTDDGVALIKRLNPGLTTQKKNVAEFREPGEYDLIFSREIYPFTRINAYADQSKAVSNIVDSLKPGGVFLLAGSDVCRPDCLDYDRLIREFREDSRLRRVTGKHYEFIFKRLGGAILGPLSCRLIELALAPVIECERLRRGFARIYLIGFVKK